MDAQRREGNVDTPGQVMYSPDANQVPISIPIPTSIPLAPSPERLLSHSTSTAATTLPPLSLSLPLPTKLETSHSSQPQDQPPAPSRGTLITCAALHAVSFAWSIYCAIRYGLVLNRASSSVRQSYTAAFLALTCASGLVFLWSSFVVAVFSFASRRSPSWIAHQSLLFLGSALLLTPTLFNLAFVSLWRHRGEGRCAFDLDVLWKDSARCTPSGDAWLAGAVLRFVVTFGFLVALHWISWALHSPAALPSIGRPFSVSGSAGNRPRSHSTVALMGQHQRHQGSSRPPRTPPNKLRRTSSSQQPSPISNSNSPSATNSNSSHHGHRRTFSGGGGSQTVTYIPHHLAHQHQPERRTSLNSEISEHYAEVDDGGDLGRFAANFRTLVERVSRETEDGARLPGTAAPASPPSNSTRTGYSSPPTSPPRPGAGRRSYSPSSHRSSSTEEAHPFPHLATTGHHPSTSSPTSQSQSQTQLQRDLLTAHRLMLLEQAMRAESYEHVLVLGGAVRRMSTIPSIPESEREPPLPWTPTSGSYMTPRELTRSPTSSTAGGRRNPGGRQYPAHYPSSPPSTAGSTSTSTGVIGSSGANLGGSGVLPPQSTGTTTSGSGSSGSPTAELPQPRMSGGATSEEEV